MADLSTYHIPADANRWMQRYSGAGYENFFPLCPGGVSPEGEKYTDFGIPCQLADTSWIEPGLSPTILHPPIIIYSLS